MAWQDTVVFNSGIRTFDKEVRSFGAIGDYRRNGECRRRKTVGHFEGQLHIPVIILIPGGIAEIVQNDKVCQRDIIILGFVLIIMLYQRRNLEQLVQFGSG